MNRFQQSLFFLFAAIWLSCIFLCSCENDEAKVKSINQKKIGVEEARNINLNYSIGGKTKAIITAPLMLNVQDINPYVLFPKNVHANFYNQDQLIESKMDAKYAKYQQNQSEVFLKDSVVVINIEKGDTLYCDELYWDRKKYGKEFYTEKPVKIRTKTEVINGLGMEASQDFKNWHILHSVGTIGISASDFPQ